MAKTDKAKSALPYARRLLEDEYVQEQLRNAAGALRSAYGRARREKANATEDKRLYGNLRQAATSLRRATSALQRPQPQPKPKRWLRKAVTLACTLGGCVWLTMKLQRQHGTEFQRGQTATPAETFPGRSEAPEQMAPTEQTATPTP